MSATMPMTSIARRRLLQGTALALAAVPLAACGGGGGTKSSSGDVTTLKILDYDADDPDNGIFAEALEAAAKKVGVTIER